jgi:uncharacterized protein with von Willebrand factor type A (vWA) domain
MERLTGHFRSAAWLNPAQERYWSYTQSISLLRDLMRQRMYPLTLSGLDDMTRELSH